MHKKDEWESHLCLCPYESALCLAFDPLLHWEEGRPLQRKVVPTQWLAVRGWALDWWEPAPFYGTSPQNTQYCGGGTKFLFRWTTKQVLKSLGSSKHTAKILPPEQVCPFFCVTLNILTSFIKIWQKDGNTFLTNISELGACRQERTCR